MNLKEGFYYEAELIEMGIDVDGTTADESLWINGQTHWNIWVVLRDGDGEYHSEVLDLDIPVAYEKFANLLFQTVQMRIQHCNTLRVELS